MTMTQDPIAVGGARDARRDDHVIEVGAGAATRHPARRYEELEGIRGIAALLVIFYHVPYWHPLIHRLPIVENGRLMVQLFFVLSGFVISNAYRQRLKTPRALLDFQILRFGRLYPVHLLYLAFFVAVEFGKVFMEARYGITSNNTEAFRQNSWTAVVEQLLLVQPIGPTGNALSFNSPAWSIGVEFYTYLLFGFVVLWIPRLFLPIAAVLSFVSIYLLGWVDVGDWNLVLRGLSGFFLGCLVQELATRGNAFGTRYLLAVGVIAMAVFLWTPQTVASECWIFALSAMIIHACAVGPENAIRRVLRSSFFAWLGRISYSVYMSHLAMIWIVSQVVRFSRSGPPKLVVSPGGHIDIEVSFPEALIACAAVLSLTLLVATVVNRLVEEPFRDATRRWVASRR